MSILQVFTAQMSPMFVVYGSVKISGHFMLSGTIVWFVKAVLIVSDLWTRTGGYTCVNKPKGSAQWLKRHLK